MAWTQEQQAAIDSRGQTLLLSAAAGSGKTAVLVERIIKRLLDTTDPVDITELLVVTFTKAAAAEMRDRVGAALAEELAKQDNPAIEKQLALLPSAHISTLHSFCQTVIRRYFYTIDIDPKFIVAGTEELNLLRHKVLEGLFLSYYEDETKAAVLYPVVDMLGTDRGDEALAAAIGRIYDFSRSMPWPEHWLTKAADLYDIPENMVIDDLPWISPVVRQIQATLLEQIRTYDEILRRLVLFPGLKAGQDQLTEEYNAMKMALSRKSWESLARGVNAVSFATLKSCKKASAEEKEYWSTVKSLRSDVKKKIKELQEQYFSVDAKQWLQDVRSMKPVINGLVRLTEDFAKAYEQAKRKKGWIDFSDLEHHCLHILLAPDSTPEQPIRSAAAQELQTSFKEVMIDEYQDTNAVQELITALISGETNRFMVGDIKQSIYRFRLADPTLFLSKYLSFSRDSAAGQRCIDLSRNFRSAANILAAVNQVFQWTMTQAATGMDYGEREQLYAGRSDCTVENWVGGPIEVHLLGPGGAGETKHSQAEDVAAAEDSSEQELTSFEQECLLVAKRLRSMKDSGLLIERKDGTMEPLAWRHMVILMRSLAGKAEVMLQALQTLGIPAYAEQNGGYFDAVEVQVMLALLRCIDNPEQDLPMAAVLRSPIVGLSEESLAKLKLSGNDTLWQHLPAYVDSLDEGGEKKRLAAFCQSLDTWRTVGRRGGVADLIQRLYDDTAYVQYVSGMAGGAARQANLRALYDRARQYEAAGYRGLFRYLQLLDKMRDEGLDLAPADVSGEGEDVVRIMTIHKSKGLEFPVVVVADAGKQFNRRDLDATLLFHQNGGIGLKYYDPSWRLLYPTLVWNSIRAQLSWESKAEEERVLYVAMTRARDKLIITGHVRDLSKKWQIWRQAEDPQQAGSYLDWIMPVLVCRDACLPAEALIRQGKEGTFDTGLWQLHIRFGMSEAQAEERPDDQDRRLEAVRCHTLTDTAVPEWLDEQLSWQYAWPLAVQTPAKVSVSEIKRQQQLLRDEVLQEDVQLAQPIEGIQDDNDIFSRIPPWLEAEQETEGGAKRGTVLHKVMQYVALQPAVTAANLTGQLVQWQADGLFMPDEVKLVRIPAVLAFCQSSLGRRMAASPVLYREYPFSVLLPGGGYLPSLEEGERVMVQGVIDCLFREEDGWVLIDYKTDRLDDAADFIDRYAVQLSLYKQALEQIMEEQVTHCYIYSFHMGKSIAFPTEIQV